MIGDLNYRVTIKPLTKSATGTGGNTESYASNNITRWASVEYKNQNRQTEGGGLNMVNELIFKIRWDSALELILDKTTIITLDSLNYTIKDFKLDTITDTYFFTIIGVNAG